MGLQTCIFMPSALPAQVEYFGLRTTSACGGVSYSVVRMYVAKAVAVGADVQTEVADTIGFVPTADLEFCRNTSCGACGEAECRSNRSRQVQNCTQGRPPPPLEAQVVQALVEKRTTTPVLTAPSAAPAAAPRGQSMVQRMGCLASFIWTWRILEVPSTHFGAATRLLPATKPPWPMCWWTGCAPHLRAQAVPALLHSSP